MGEILDTQVAIVGAGPAGLSAAEASCKLGAEVIVVERSSEIGYPVHTSGGTWTKEMKEFRIPESCYNPITRTIFSSPSHDAEFALGDQTACILRVRQFYQHLACRAISSGATTLLSTNAISMEEEDRDSVTVKALEHGRAVTIRGRVCIDCSGFPAVIGRSSGLVDTWRRYGLGAEYEAWVEYVDPSTTILQVGSDVSPAGYAWIFPLGEHRARIGVGVLRPDVADNPLDLLNRLVRRPARHVKSLGRIVPLELHIGSAPAEGPVACSGRGRLLLAGDAAGQVAPHVGEGIRFAMQFGKMAAEAAVSVVAKKDEASINLYDRRWKDVSERRFKLALMMQRKATRLSDDGWDQGVEILKSLSTQEYVSLLRLDFTKRFLVGLIANHPRLMVYRGLLVRPVTMRSYFDS